jgi:hypothetical protein
MQYAVKENNKNKGTTVAVLKNLIKSDWNVIEKTTTQVRILYIIKTIIEDT